MDKKLRSVVIAVGIASGLAVGLQSLRSLVPGFDPGVAGYTIPMGVVVMGVLLAQIDRSGNRETPVADDATRTGALTFAPEPGHGSLVFIRTGRGGRTVGFDMSVDGQFAVQLMTPRFAVVRAAVGRHLIFADIPNAPGPSAVKPAEIEVAEGAVLFFRVKMAMGLVRASLRLDPEPDTPALRAELARMPMAQPEQSEQGARLVPA